MQDVTARAIAAIGSTAKGDYKLRPKKHAEALGAGAKALKHIIEQDAFETTSDAYEMHGKDAGAAQKRFKRRARAAATLALLSLLISSVVLIAQGLFPDESAPLITELSIASVGAILGSLFFSLLQNTGAPFRKWMTSRAEAETMRMRLFNDVIAADGPADPDGVPLLALKLEYFRRYQLEVQINYYEQRGADHRRFVWRAKAARVLSFGLILVAIALPFSAFFGYQWETLLGHAPFADDLERTAAGNRALIGFSTAGAAIQGWLAAQLLLGQDERNALRYAATLENLQALAGAPLEEARRAAAAGDPGPVRNFVTLTQEQISSEHREWVSLRTISPEMDLKYLRDRSLPF